MKFSKFWGIFSWGGGRVREGNKINLEKPNRLEWTDGKKKQYWFYEREKIKRFAFRCCQAGYKIFSREIKLENFLLVFQKKKKEAQPALHILRSAMNIFFLFSSKVYLSHNQNLKALLVDVKCSNDSLA